MLTFTSCRTDRCETSTSHWKEPSGKQVARRLVFVRSDTLPEADETLLLLENGSDGNHGVKELTSLLVWRMARWKPGLTRYRGSIVAVVVGDIAVRSLFGYVAASPRQCWRSLAIA
jgi:hypothetical protein